MKQLPAIVLACCLLFACDQIKPIDSADDGSATDTSNCPYTAKYTSSFEIGDAKYAKTVLTVEKSYEDNTFDNVKGAFADTVIMDFADGSSFRGPKDSLVKTITAARSGYASVSNIFAMWVTLKPKGKEETWVSVWCRETDVLKDSTKQSAFLDENWEFNKDGKIMYMMQNARKPHAIKR